MTKLIPLKKVDGEPLTYFRSNEVVMIPENYKKPDEDFRGVWVTLKDSTNLTKFSTIENFKNEICEIFDVMNYYNLNGLIFHIRIDNDAIYESKLNPWSAYFTEYNNNPGWDPLPWLIEETHKRGYEFHAWMNPYRVKSGNIAPINEEYEKVRIKFSKTIPSFNIASNPNNLLLTKHQNNTYGAILDPGLPEVKDFIIATCMEVIEKYDIDAIHFDDYFYANLGEHGENIINENDQSTYLKYKEDYQDPKSNLDKADFRRKQINIFIKELSSKIRSYNLTNNRFVQLGVSPTGIYKNGDGLVIYNEYNQSITNGSNTIGQTHFSSYLFCDTLKWLNNQWIDYMVPQSYWAFEHKTAGYADVMDWWDKVAQKSKVNIYSGIGIYMSEVIGGNYSWGSNYLEVSNQLKYTTKLNNVKGNVFYNYRYLKYAYKLQGNELYQKGMDYVKEHIYTSKAILPKIRTYNASILEKVNNVNRFINNNEITISWNKVDDAKSYVIYKSLNDSFNADDIVDIISNYNDSKDIIFKDNYCEGYNYAIAAISKTNHVGKLFIIKSVIDEIESLIKNQNDVIKNLY